MLRIPCRTALLLQNSQASSTQFFRLFRSTSTSSSDADAETIPTITNTKPKQVAISLSDLTAEEIWKRRSQLAKPTIQRNEKLPLKVYYAPQWEFSHENPLKQYGMTPEKWEYYNKIVWPPNYVVPETGLPKAREVFHCRESVHYSPKRMWNACQLVRRMVVSDAIDQLKFRQIKGTMMLAEVIEEAIKRAREEFHIPNPEQMFVAEAFPIQYKIVKGSRRHAKDRYTVMRYRYIHIFVRLEEGPPPSYKKRAPADTNWELMRKYYEYLRNRDIKYSL